VPELAFAGGGTASDRDFAVAGGGEGEEWAQTRVKGVAQWGGDGVVGVGLTKAEPGRADDEASGGASTGRG
jgi:hypothetical protein